MKRPLKKLTLNKQTLARVAGGAAATDACTAYLCSPDSYYPYDCIPQSENTLCTLCT